MGPSGLLDWLCDPRNAALELVSGRLDTSGSMIPLLVPEISPWAFFVTVQGGDEEVGILVVGFLLHRQDF